MVLSGRFVALAALGVLAAIASAIDALIFAATLALAVAVDLTRAARVADLVVTREPSASVRLGETGSTTLLVGNRGRRTARTLIRDAWVPSAGVSPRAQSLRIGPGERRELRSRLRPTRRGERRAAQVVLRSYGPIGLAARQRRTAVPGSLRVLPPFTSRRFLPEKLSRLRLIDGTVLMRHRGQGTEFDSLRSYVLGDDVRAIDWRASARSRDVAVRTWRPERDRTLVVALDTGRAAAARLGDATRLDAALDAALLLGAIAARAGDRVAVVAADIAVRARVAPLAGADVLPGLVTALTTLEPALVETDPVLLAAEVRRQVTKRSLVVLFGALDTAAETGLVPAARSLAVRHEVIVAAVSDPWLDELAARRADDAEVYTAAAAERAAGLRREVSRRLVGLGATVVDAPADLFASRLADAYLDLKAAGRL